MKTTSHRRRPQNIKIGLSQQQPIESFPKDLFIPYTLGGRSFLTALITTILVLIKYLSFYDSLEMENSKINLKSHFI